MKPSSGRRTLLIAAAIAIAAVAGYTLLGSQPGAGTAAITHLGPEAFMERMQGDPGAVVVDVRTPAEFQSGHLPGAINVELDRLEGLASTALPDRNARLLVYCRSGNRSSFAVNILEKQGYTRLVNMTGGIAQWSAQGYPVVVP
jgi:rhodanese-related sulfurtransferase